MSATKVSRHGYLLELYRLTTVTRDKHDIRHHFAHRFEAIAKLHGVSTEGLLILDDTVQPEEGERALANPPATTWSCQYDSPTTIQSSTSSQQAPSLLVPGLLGDSVRNLVAPMLCARQQLECLGYNIDVAWVNGRTGSGRNAAVLREQILRAADAHASAVNIIAYSKGCADCLHMLGQYPDTHDAVRSLVSLVGVVQGTPLAEDPPWLLRKLLQYTPVPGVPFGDGRAIMDMSYKVRKQWLEDHPLPSSIYLAAIAAAPSRSRVSRVLKGSYDRLATSNPANDSQMIAADTIVPGGDLLAIVNADHWAIALPVQKRLPLIARLLVDQNAFPRDVLLRALIEHLNDIDCTRL